jgi:hypothetical protein
MNPVYLRWGIKTGVYYFIKPSNCSSQFYGGGNVPPAWNDRFPAATTTTNAAGANWWVDTNADDGEPIQGSVGWRLFMTRQLGGAYHRFGLCPSYFGTKSDTNCLDFSADKGGGHALAETVFAAMDSGYDVSSYSSFGVTDAPPFAENVMRDNMLDAFKEWEKVGAQAHSAYLWDCTKMLWLPAGVFILGLSLAIGALHLLKHCFGVESLPGNNQFASRREFDKCCLVFVAMILVWAMPLYLHPIVSGVAEMDDVFMNGDNWQSMFPYCSTIAVTNYDDTAQEYANSEGSIIDVDDEKENNEVPRAGYFKVIYDVYIGFSSTIFCICVLRLCYYLYFVTSMPSREELDNNSENYRMLISRAATGSVMSGDGDVDEEKPEPFQNEKMKGKKAEKKKNASKNGNDGVIAKVNWGDYDWNKILLDKSEKSKAYRPSYSCEKMIIPGDWLHFAPDYHTAPQHTIDKKNMTKDELTMRYDVNTPSNHPGCYNAWVTIPKLKTGDLVISRPHCPDCPDSGGILDGVSLVGFVYDVFDVSSEAIWIDPNGFLAPEVKATIDWLVPTDDGKLKSVCKQVRYYDLNVLGLEGASDPEYEALLNFDVIRTRTQMEAANDQLRSCPGYSPDNMTLGDLTLGGGCRPTPQALDYFREHYCLFSSRMFNGKNYNDPWFTKYTAKREKDPDSGHFTGSSPFHTTGDATADADDVENGRGLTSPSSLQISASGDQIPEAQPTQRL